MDKRNSRFAVKMAVLFLKVFIGVVGIGILGIVLCVYNMDEEQQYEVFSLLPAPLAEMVEAEQTEAETRPEDAGPVSILFAGDILLDDSYAMMTAYRNRGSELTNIFSPDLIARMQRADIFMINNEFTFTERGVPIQGKQFTFRSKPENVVILQNMGVDIVSVANNHIYDYGEISLLDTLDTLETAEILHTGAGRNLEEAMKPVYYEMNGMKIAFVSATQIERNAVPDTREAGENTPGVLRCMDPENLKAVIKEAKENSDFVILYIHWGTESQETIDWLQEEQALIYAQAGVDLIIGDHPHCLQKIDSVAGVPVIYSVGNFWFNSKTQNSCMVEITLQDGVMQSFQFIPCVQSDCSTSLLEGEEKAELISYMRQISPNVTIDADGYVNF